MKKALLIILPILLLVATYFILFRVPAPVVRTLPENLTAVYAKKNFFAAMEPRRPEKEAPATPAPTASPDEEVKKPAWKDFKIPDKEAILAEYGPTMAELRTMLAKKHDIDSGVATPEKKLGDGRYAIETLDNKGEKINQVRDEQSHFLLSERWVLKKYGVVTRFYHRNQNAVVLHTDDEHSLKTDLVTIAPAKVEYFTVRDGGRGIAFLRDNGTENLYFADNKENRYIEYTPAGNHQWQNVGDNRFQQIDEDGNAQSFFKVDLVSGAMVPAE